MRAQDLPPGAPCALYQVSETDLAILEKTLPQLAGALMPVLNNRLRMKLRQVQKILSDVRWSYGPPTEVEAVRPQDDHRS